MRNGTRFDRAIDNRRKTLEPTDQIRPECWKIVRSIVDFQNSNGRLFLSFRRVFGNCKKPSAHTRPTVDGVEPLLEVHIFDFDRDIYGAYIKVEFVARLRDEVRFDDLESLTEQMHVDAAQARAILAAA